MILAPSSAATNSQSEFCEVKTFYLTKVYLNRELFFSQYDDETKTQTPKQDIA